MKDVSLKLSEICKTFGSGERTVRVLNGITLDLRGGQSLVIMGPSGSGKSTLLHLIGTLDKPTSGTVEINGKNPFSLSEPDLAHFRNQGIGFVFQDHHLLPQYTVLENVMLPALAFRSNNSDPQSRALALLKRVGLEHRVEHYPAQLSGGESQRTAVARALMNEPSMVLCDEPTGNLDHANAESIASLLFELHQQEKNLLITVTHSQDLAGRFEQCLELRDGTLQQKP